MTTVLKERSSLKRAVYVNSTSGCLRNYKSLSILGMATVIFKLTLLSTVRIPCRERFLSLRKTLDVADCSVFVLNLWWKICDISLTTHSWVVRRLIINILAFSVAFLVFGLSKVLYYWSTKIWLSLIMARLPSDRRNPKRETSFQFQWSAI